MTVFDLIKRVIFIIMLLLFAPFIIRTINRQYSNLFESRTPIAVLPIRGIIYDSSVHIQQLHQFFANPDIKGILLKIECPVTALGTGEIIYTEIQALKRQYPKPVIGLIENVCFSGGYWIACAADYLIAPGAALIGNIGTTFSHFVQCKEFIEHYHLNCISKTNTHTTSNLPTLDSQTQELMHLILDDIYHQFVQVVAQARKISVNKKEQWADGKIFNGHQAQKLHLIDEIGCLEHAITIFKQKALIDGAIEWVYPTTAGSWKSLLFGINEWESNLVKTMDLSGTTQTS